MLEAWSTLFPGLDPIAHRMPHELPHRWVRFHSLPESKRYPESDAEHVIVLQRHNFVLDYLHDPASSIVLLTTEFSERPTPSAPPSESPSSRWWQTVAHDEAWWHIYTMEATWTPGLFDPIIRRVAEDWLPNVMICDATCRWLVHPYDGGMDVILASTPERDRLRARFVDWLSPYPGGW